MRKVEAQIHIAVSAEEVIDAFVNPEHLAGWWGVERCLVEAEAGGLYTLAWQISEDGFGYVSTGRVEIYESERLLKIGNLVYMNPQKPLLGPMSLSVQTETEAEGTLLTVIQDGYGEGEVWDWYYGAVKQAWPEVLKILKTYLEDGQD